MTDKSARDEIARHYAAHEIGGSLDDMYEFERERCYDFTDRLIAALDAAGWKVRAKEIPMLSKLAVRQTAMMQSKEQK